ncbi:MAG TPA: bifunctional 2-polyprenyl-6-hydroxyphenol methylase/3-demethylubiquinol 3-O-methyltransferase UbiG, partial [Salinisphaeraceae bacterium]|nr:bifunctional 2-polyprenyl-6-hydroxyphenol methylase/3-demethylubiquinol 3-O-methyltransferase UbiG [Salinisphaeraceae bacterium]
MNASTQEQELDKFARMADQWWDPQGPMRPLHDINPLRLDYVAERAPLDGALVADIGCGAGIFSEALAGRGASVTGTDLAQPMIEVARAHARESGLDIDYQCISSRDLAARRRGEFDLVTCMELLEHVDEPAAVIDDCAQLLRPGGTAIFSTINRNAKAWLLAIAGAE